GYEGRIVLVGDEPSLPYERPPLSKAVLRGEAQPAETHVHPERFYLEHGVELVNDTVVSLDPTDQRLVLASGEQMAFGTAIIATGAEPRRIDLPGADLAGIHYLRTIGDSLRLQSAIRGASRVAVIGAGWIGSEVAASARQMRADVVLIDPAPTPL